jgi:hypothetical protein
MGFWQFWHEHPVLAFFALCAAYYTLKWIVRTPFHMWNRLMRHKNIAAQGWPPPHLDADGDFKPELEEEETA